jgi:hypothetical protein
MNQQPNVVGDLRNAAYQIDPVLWVREVLGVTPTAWRQTFLRAPRGASILALTARQVGKTTTAAWAIAHAMVFMPGSLSVIACPAQRQSAEAVRRIREILLKVGAKLVSDNVYALELENGSRVLAPPGTDDSIRGLTVDAWIVADEAARLSEDIIAALRPMRARRPQARLAMLSTAWSRTDPFWTAWASDDPTWIRLKATVDMDPSLFPAEYLEQERMALGEHAFKREYLRHSGQWRRQSLHLGALCARDRFARTVDAARSGFRATAAAAAGASAQSVSRSHIARSSPMTAISIDPRLWPHLHPLLIAHDVGGSRDRSTAVVGGFCTYAPGILGIKEFNELPQDLYGSMRASALAQVDARYDRNALIVADLSNDSSYGEQLLETFGPRVIGVHIGPRGDGMTFERRPVGRGCLPIYHVGRSHLLEALHSDLQAGRVCFADGPEARRAYAQLEALEPEIRQGGMIYKCLPGQHDDLGISCTMLNWAARHPHLELWIGRMAAARRPRRPRQTHGWGAFT